MQLRPWWEKADPLGTADDRRGVSWPPIGSVRQIESHRSRIASGGWLPHQRTSSSLYVYDFGGAKPSCLKQVLLPDSKDVREFFADAAYMFPRYRH